MSPSLLDPKFVGLLACIGFARLICPIRYYPSFCLVATIGLFCFAAPATLILVSAITLLVLYPVHLLTRTGQARSWSRRWTRLIVATGIIVLVMCLLLFKLDRSIEIAPLKGEWIHTQVAGLIGFSYFIFRAIGFIHIQSILHFKESTPVPLLYYVLFPSTLTSGPIQKYQDFREQISNPEPMSFKLAWESTYRITRGFFRKIVLAAGLDKCVQYLLAVNELNIWLSVAIIVFLYLYFYFDFAGYCDIAIGLGLLLGIRVPENFRKPFSATTVAEFWRNWHITLADWLRDQVFIPLGGMRASRRHAAVLAFAIMVMCGLWHGITWSFLAWGLWHGSILCAEGLMGVKPVPPAQRHGPRYWVRVLWTNGRVAVGAIFFLPVESIQRLLIGITSLGI